MAIRYSWHVNAFHQIRTDPSVQALAREHAEQILERANALASTKGAEYEIGKEGILDGPAPRFRISVHPANVKGMVDNAAHNTLLKAVGGSE